MKSWSLILLHIMCLFNVYDSYRDGRILKVVSPPFGPVANQAYDNIEIVSLLRDPNNYNPRWGKSGIAFSIMYYIRNARLAIQHTENPQNVMINNENYKQIWSKLFKWEMDIFTDFRNWYDDRNNDEKWRQFVLTVYNIFNDKLKRFLAHFANMEIFTTSMPVYAENGLGPKFLVMDDNKVNIHLIPSDLEFDKINPFIPELDNKFPLIGFGSWPLTGDECKDAVLKALKTGYRLIDTSENYNNEKVIGEAMRESGIERSKILIASKLSVNEHYGQSKTTEAFEASLDNLGVDYIDVYMLHGAISDKQRLKEAWLELEDLYKAGKIKYLGVSNFGPHDMNQLLTYASIKPSFVQNKFDPFTVGQQTPWGQSIEDWVNHYNKVVRKEGDPQMIVQAYCVLNSWPHQVSAVKDKHIEWIASKYDVSAAQLLIRWALQHKNVGVLTRSSQEHRQLSNLDIFHFRISEVDMQLINGLVTLFSPFDIQWMHDVYGQVSMRPNLDKVEL